MFSNPSIYHVQLISCAATVQQLMVEITPYSPKQNISQFPKKKQKIATSNSKITISYDLSWTQRNVYFAFQKCFSDVIVWLNALLISNWVNQYSHNILIFENLSKLSSQQFIESFIIIITCCIQNCRSFDIVIIFMYLWIHKTKVI